MFSMSFIWKNGGEVSAILCRGAQSNGLEQYRKYLAEVKESWGERVGVPILIQLSLRCWEDLKLYAPNVQTMLELAEEMKGFMFILPDAELLGSNASETLDYLKAAKIVLLLGELKLKPKHINLMTYAQGCELNYAKLGRDVCANLGLKLLGSKQWCFITEVDQWSQVLDLEHIGVAPFTGSVLFKRKMLNKVLKLDANLVQTLKLIQMVNDQVDLIELEREIKENPALSYKLLSLINSAALRTQKTISTVKEALILMGYKSISIWLSMLLLSASEKQNQNIALQFSLLMRARLCSFIVNEKNKKLAEEAFVCGLFSGLDAYFDAPMQDLLQKVNFPDYMKEALLEHKGVLGAALLFAKKVEESPEQMQALCTSLELKEEDVSLWVQESFNQSLNLHSLKKY